MTFKVLSLALVGLLMLGGTAEAIDGPRAVRHIRQYVDEDCHSYGSAGARCLGWEVSHCYKLGRRKVRCKAWQEYRRHGNWRICRFAVAAVERRDHRRVDLHFGTTRCYSESGELIP